MTRRLVSLPTMLLWVLMALLPLRSVASAWMTAAPAVAASAADLPCHTAADVDESAPTGTEPGTGTGTAGQGACHHCDLCHSPTLVGSAPNLASVDTARRIGLALDARVPAAGQQPQRRPPRA